MNKTIPLALLLAGISLGTLQGCSISSSIESSSDIVSSPFSSSSGDDSGSDFESDSSDDLAAENISNYTRKFVEMFGGMADEETFRYGIGEISQQEGISDWENNPVVWMEVGRGLKAAGLPQAELDIVVNSLTKGDREKVSVILDGYNTPTYQY